LDDKEDEELSEEMKSKAILEGEKKDVDDKGVPEFWLTIFKNVELLAEMVQDHDEPILKHLTDIKVHYKEDPMGFVLDFHFSPNDHFENTVLTKSYDMKCEADAEDPFSFEGPEIHKCKVIRLNFKSLRSYFYSLLPILFRVLQLSGRKARISLLKPLRRSKSTSPRVPSAPSLRPFKMIPFSTSSILQLVHC